MPETLLVVDTGHAEPTSERPLAVALVKLASEWFRGLAPEFAIPGRVGCRTPSIE